MKKLFVMLLAASMLLSLCACGKSEEVVNVESLISTIGTVSLKSEGAILEAEKAYKALPATISAYSIADRSHFNLTVFSIVALLFFEVIII
jgi:hypothetical protein